MREAYPGDIKPPIMDAHQILRRWGDTESVTTKVTRRRLQWLGHLARMPDHRLPQTALFAWLPQRHTRCGPHRRWIDVIRNDLKMLGVPEGEWYREAYSRNGWRARCQIELDSREDDRDHLQISDQLPSHGECHVTSAIGLLGERVTRAGTSVLRSVRSQ